MENNIIEKEVTVSSDFELSGTLSFPKDKKENYPAIIIIPGTGTSDRNGNTKQLKTRTYRLLSEYLNSLSYATFRYDKRGLHKSKGNFLESGVNDFLNDIENIYKFIETQESIDSNNIILLGHSEGSILSTIVSERINPKGYILISGAGTSLKTSLETQNEYAYQEIQRMKGFKGLILKFLYSKNKIKKTQEKLFKKVKDTGDDVVKYKSNDFPAKWLKEHLDYTNNDILNKLENIDVPVLCITGSKDVQASTDDLEKIKELNKDNIDVEIIEKMDHILRYYDGEKTILNISEQYYSESDKPLHSELKENLKEWLKSNIN